MSISVLTIIKIHFIMISGECRRRQITAGQVRKKAADYAQTGCVLWFCLMGISGFYPLIFLYKSPQPFDSVAIKGTFNCNTFFHIFAFFLIFIINNCWLVYNISLFSPVLYLICEIVAIKGTFNYNVKNCIY